MALERGGFLPKPHSVEELLDDGHREKSATALIDFAKAFSMKSTPLLDPKHPRFAFWQRGIEPTLAVAMILFLALGWFVAWRYQDTLTRAVTHAYQETQTQIVRAVARNAAFFVQREMERNTPIAEIEQELFNRFVAPVKLLENGDAWIYAPDHVVFDRSSDFPEQYRGKSMAEIFATQVHLGARHYEEMTRAVTEAREGVGWYIWLPEKGKEIAAWTPVRMGPHVWTIGLSTPLSEILVATGAQQQRGFILTIMTGTTLIGLVMVVLALWGLNRRRVLDGRLRHSHTELSRSVRELECEIARRQQAEEERRRLDERLMQVQKMEAIGTLAGGVAHDLNNILAGLVSYPELLLTTLTPASPLYKPIQTIQQSGQRAAAVVQDLLTLSRRSRKAMEVVDLNRIVGDYLASAEHGRLVTDQPATVVNTLLQHDLLPIRGEPVSLTKALSMQRAPKKRGRASIFTFRRSGKKCRPRLPGPFYPPTAVAARRSWWSTMWPCSARWPAGCSPVWGIGSRPPAAGRRPWPLWPSNRWTW